MSGVKPAILPGTAPGYGEFLASDFAVIDAVAIDRCMQFDGRRLYLSGATGFFGKCLLALLVYLQRRGASFHVTALSRSPQAFLAAHPWCRNLDWLDWQQGDALTKWPGDGTYDCLIHAATDTNVGYHADKLKVFDEILAGTRNALDFSAAHGVKRFLLTGSGAQYGAIPNTCLGGVPESARLACDTTKAASAYGEAKRASEMLATLHGRRHGFDVVSARCFAFIGPGLHLDGHFAIGNFLRDALDGTPIRLATSGEAVRSYLYGADLAVWLLVLLMEADNGSAVNVGSDRAIKLVDLAKRVRDVVNPRLEVRCGADHCNEPRQFYVPSISYARSLGLDAWTQLDQAIARTALWHRGRRADFDLPGAAHPPNRNTVASHPL